MLSSVHHIRAPINGDTNRIKTIRLVTEHNPVMAARLPGPAWRVFHNEFADHAVQAVRDGTPMATTTDGGIPLTDLTVHGTYSSEAEANEAARSLTQRKLNTVHSYRPGTRTMANR
jgi:hypothetical protein